MALRSRSPLIIRCDWFCCRSQVQIISLSSFMCIAVGAVGIFVEQTHYSKYNCCQEHQNSKEEELHTLQ